MLNKHANNSIREEAEDEEDDHQQIKKRDHQEMVLDKEFQEDNNYENYVNYFKSKGILFPRSMWTGAAANGVGTWQGQEMGGASAEGEEQEKNVLNQRENSQRKTGLKLALNLEELVLRRPFQLDDQGRVVVDEAGVEGEVPGGLLVDCEYDSERGKFNCDDIDLNNMMTGFGQEDMQDVRGQEVERMSQIGMEGHNKNNNKRQESVNNINVNNVLGTDQKGALLVNKKIEYFENKLKPSKEDNRLREERGLGLAQVDRVKDSFCEEKQGNNEEEEMEGQRKLINILCLGSFFMTALLFYLFPLPT